MKRGREFLRHTYLIWGVLALCLVLALPQAVRADEAYGFILPESSSRLYTEAEIADMPLQVVNYAKNELYARNGRMFNSTELQNYFNQQYWYVPLYAPDEFVEGMLNTYESSNARLLAAREKELGTYQLDVAGYSYAPVYSYIDAEYSSVSGYSVDPDSYLFYDSNSRYLSETELTDLTLQELCYARNEIFARRGRLFNSAELQNYFDLKSWYFGYIEPDAFDSSVLNEYEKANVTMLMNAEYARSSGGYALDSGNYTYDEVGAYTSYVTIPVTDDDFIFYDSNIRYLTDAEIAGLTVQEMCYARNEIYARRGYIFQSQELRDYFGAKSWYHGTMTASEFTSAVFNEYEAANVEALKQFEYSISPNGYQLK